MEVRADLVQQPDALLPLLPELRALLLHLLAEQRAPHAHALLQLAPLPRALAVRRHPGLALVGGEDLELALQPVRQLVCLLLLGLVQSYLRANTVSRNYSSNIYNN